jgi:hypothetical protein
MIYPLLVSQNKSNTVNYEKPLFWHPLRHLQGWQKELCHEATYKFTRAEISPVK